MNNPLRNALIAAAAVVVVVLALPFLVPLDAYRGRIENTVGEATGRSFKIEGPLRLMLFPHPGLRAQRVTLANMPGGRAAAMATVGDIELSVRLLPLLTGRVELDKIVLNKPVIALEVDAEGHANWTFARNKPAKAAPSGGSSVTLPATAQFSGLEIEDGAITYDNARTGTHRSIDHVNAEVAITRPDQPVSATGNLTIGPRQLDFTARVATLQTLLGSGTTALDLKAHADIVQAEFKGLLPPEGGASGSLKLDTPDLRGLAAWLGESLPGGGLGPLSLQSRIVSYGKVTTFAPMRLILDGQSVTGTLTLDRTSGIALDGALAVDRLDLNPYLAAKPTARAAGKTTSGWSKSPIDLGVFRKLAARLTITTGSLRLRGLHLGRTVLRLEADHGRVTARFDPVSLYGGSGRLQLEAEDRGPALDFRVGANLRNIALRPFLDDALGIDSIEGAGALDLDISGRGRSADAIMHSLSGKGSIAAAQGRFRGVDLGRVARSVSTLLGGDATGRLAATDFHSMGGSFVIARGVLGNNDFRLAGPVLQMRGAGNIDIGGRSIDFRLEPSAAIEGVDIGIPFRLRGSWDKVHYAPDYAEILGGVADNLRAGRAPFKGLFGGGDNKKPQKKKKKSIGDELKDILGVH